MTHFLSRRSALLLAASAMIFPTARSDARENQVVTVHKDPNCDCCSRWVQHLHEAGFTVKAVESKKLDALKSKLGVPPDLAACHTAQVGKYVVEGHVPAAALARLLAEKPNAIGLAVAGMPVGSPGMEGGTPEPFEVVLFGPGRRRVYMRFLADRILG